MVVNVKGIEGHSLVGYQVIIKIHLEDHQGRIMGWGDGVMGRWGDGEMG